MCVFLSLKFIKSGKEWSRLLLGRPEKAYRKGLTSTSILNCLSDTNLGGMSLFLKRFFFLVILIEQRIVSIGWLVSVGRFYKK